MTCKLDTAWHKRCSLANHLALAPPNPETKANMIRDTSAQDRRIQPEHSPRRWIPIGVAIAVVLVALVWVVPTVARLISAGSAVSASSVRISAVKRGTLTRDISAQGKVVAAVSPTLYASTAGTVTLDVHAGDKVEKDQVLAEVYSPELNSKLAQEKSTFDSLSIDVERTGIDNRQKQLTAKKTYDQALIDRQTAARDVDRNERGFKAGAIPEINVLRAKDALAKADIEVEHAKADSKLQDETLAFELRTKRLSLDRQKLLVADLERQVEMLKVRAPVSGQVGQLLVQQKANVAANVALLTVVDLSALEVELQVPEVFAHDLAIDMPAEILDGIEKFAGALSAVSPEVVEGQVVARVRFVDRKPVLRQNQRLTTRILIDEHPNVLMVERGSFVDSGAGRVAYVIRNGVA